MVQGSGFVVKLFGWDRWSAGMALARHDKSAGREFWYKLAAWHF